MLEEISKYASILLPVFALILVVILIIVAIKASVLITKLNSTVTNVDEVIHTTKNYLVELKTTVNTMNNVSMTVEACRVALQKLFRKMYRKAMTNYEDIKEFINKLVAKVEQPEDTEEIKKEGEQ